MFSKLSKPWVFVMGPQLGTSSVKAYMDGETDNITVRSRKNV